MAAKIQLSFDLLKQQSAEMTTLSREYEALFSSVITELHKLNSNWSQNLSNNFTSKIVSAQNSFSNVTNLLKTGAAAASSASDGFFTVDTALANSFSKGQSESITKSDQSNNNANEVVHLSTNSENLEDVGNIFESTSDFFDYIDEKLSNVDEKNIKLFKDIYKDVFGKTPLKKIPKAYDVIQKLNKGDYAGAISSIIDASTPSLKTNSILNLKFKTVKETLDYTFSDDVKAVIKKHNADTDRLAEDIVNGDFSTLLPYLGESFADWGKTVGKGVFKCGGKIIYSTLRSSVGPLKYLEYYLSPKDVT